MTGDEALLAYWREDPLFNEHHEHWHLVYVHAGRLKKEESTEALKRAEETGDDAGLGPFWHENHGELFVYMHAQLLARYAAERLSVGLPPLKPLDDYREPIEEGYDPGRTFIFKYDGSAEKVGPRPAGTSLQDVTVPIFIDRPGAKVINQEALLNQLSQALVNVGNADYPASLNDLGEWVEPTAKSPKIDRFGAIHNDGHIAIGLWNNNLDAPGVMYHEASAVRDPVFYRWHMRIDDIFSLYRNNLPRHDFSDPPDVLVIDLVIKSAGKQNEISTRMKTRDLKERDGTVSQIRYLQHSDFTYELRIHGSTKSQSVTIRLFIAPEANKNDRGSWIEMDKFTRNIPGRSKVLVKRKSSDSSVIRHPVITDDVLEGWVPWPEERDVEPGCRCGWPYNLLLPRGSPEGMDFCFVAVVTPGDDIQPGTLTEKSSASYCGLRDRKYPDKRPMGYPFDRPFSKAIGSWIDETPQVASATVKVIHAGLEAG